MALPPNVRHFPAPRARGGGPGGVGGGGAGGGGDLFEELDI